MRILVLGVLASGSGGDLAPGEIVQTGRFRLACFSGAYEVWFPKEDTAQLALFGPE